MYNTVNYLCYEIKVESLVKDKNNFFYWAKTLLFFKQKYILFFEIYFLKISKNVIVYAFFSEADTKKHRYALAKASNAALVKLTY